MGGYVVRFESWHQCTSGRFEATRLYWCSELGFFDLCKSQCKAGSIGQPGAESLNAAVAAAVVMWEIARTGM